MAKKTDELRRDESPGIKPEVKETSKNSGKVSRLLAPGTVLVGKGPDARVVSVPVNRHELQQVGAEINFQEQRHGDELVGHRWKEK